MGCSCCGCTVRASVIPTVAGDFESPWRLCRRCWRSVPRGSRRELIQARVEFRSRPGLETSVVLYWLWQLALSSAQWAREGRKAA